MKNFIILFIFGLLSQLSFAQVPDWAVEEAQFVNRIGVENEDFYDVVFESFEEREIPEEIAHARAQQLQRMQLEADRVSRVGYRVKFFDNGDVVQGISAIFDLYAYNFERSRPNRRMYDHIRFLPMEIDLNIIYLDRPNGATGMDRSEDIINKVKISLIRFMNTSNLYIAVDMLGIQLRNLELSADANTDLTLVMIKMLGANFRGQHSLNESNRTYIRYVFSLDTMFGGQNITDQRSAQSRDVIPDNTIFNEGDFSLIRGADVSALVRFVYEEKFLIEFFAELFVHKTENLYFTRQNEEGERIYDMISSTLFAQYGVRVSYLPNEIIGLFAQYQRQHLHYTAEQNTYSTNNTLTAGIELSFATENNR